MGGEFGSRLREVRVERGLLQRDVERALNLRPGACSQYERGLREPGFRLLVSLADLLEVSTDYLLARPGAVKESPELLAARQRLKEMIRARPLRGARLRDRVSSALALAEEAAPGLFGAERIGRRVGVEVAQLLRGAAPRTALRRLEEYLDLPLT